MMNIFIFDDDTALQMDYFRFSCKRYDSESGEFIIRVELADKEYHEARFIKEVERDNQYDKFIEHLMALVRIERQLEKDAIGRIEQNPV